MSFHFENEQDAAKGLLVDVSNLLNSHTIDYAVLGGWVPFLFNNNPILHPGTYDVDIVLNASLSKDQVVKALYMFSDTRGQGVSKRVSKEGTGIKRSSFRPQRGLTPFLRKVATIELIAA